MAEVFSAFVERIVTKERHKSMRQLGRYVSIKFWSVFKSFPTFSKLPQPEAEIFCKVFCLQICLCSNEETSNCRQMCSIDWYMETSSHEAEVFDSGS